MQFERFLFARKNKKKKLPNDTFNTFDIWISLSVSRHGFFDVSFFLFRYDFLHDSVSIEYVATAVVAVDTEMYTYCYTQ